MRALIQRVHHASIQIDKSTHSKIKHGLVVFIGIHQQDTKKEADFLVVKTLNLRLFCDDKGKFSDSVQDVKGEVLLVSQFTLYGNCLKGRRPSFDQAAPIEEARPMYDHIVEQFRLAYPDRVKSGIFQANMTVNLANDGPVSLMVEKEAFSPVSQ